MYRNSIAPPSTVRRVQRKHEDVFPILDYEELSLCLERCDMYSPVHELQRPTTQYVASLLEQILERFAGISMTKLRADLAVCTVDNEYPDFQAEARVTMSVQRLMHRFLVDCGIDDFSIGDVMRPDAERYRRILSAVVNYARFREEHTKDCEDLFAKADENLRKMDQLGAETEYLKQRIFELEKARDPQKITLAEESNMAVETELRQLKKVQERITTEYQQYHQEKEQKQVEIGNLKQLIGSARKENEKLRPYIVESSEVLHKINNDLQTSLQTNKASLESYDTRQKLLDTSSESFKLIEQDTRGLVKILDECAAELKREDEAMSKLNKYQDMHEQRTLESQSLERENQQLKRQIESNQQKIQRATRQKANKKTEVEDKMRDLQDQHSTLIAERELNAQDMERKRAYIESVEMQMDQMRQQLELEMRAVALENEQLQAHINLYLNDIEQRV